LINVLVMAGTSKKGELEEYAQVSNKALIPINGKPMLWFVLEALEGVPSLNKIKLLSSPQELEPVLSDSRWAGVEIIPEKGSLLDNLEEGLKYMEKETPCLVATSDIPLVTASIVQDFVNRCDPFDKDFYYPIIAEKDYIKEFPNAKRTYLKLKEGKFTGGNLALVKPSSILERISRLHMIFAHRKKPWKYARMLSPFMVFKFLFKQLTVPELEDYISHLMSWRVQAVSTPYVEIGADVDKPRDLDLIKEIIKQEESGGNLRSSKQ